MEKRFLSLLYSVLILIFSYKKHVAYMMNKIILSWQDIMYLLFNSVETARAKDNIDVLTAFFLITVFVVIENADIDFIWKQDAFCIYKIRIGSKFKVWGIKYVISLIIAVKYYLCTLLVCIILGRGSNNINQYDTFHIIIQPFIFLIMFSWISLAVCSVLNRMMGVIVMLVMTVLSAFYNHWLLIGNYGMYIRTPNYVKSLGIFTIMAVIFVFSEYVIKSTTWRYVNG